MNTNFTHLRPISIGFNELFKFAESFESEESNFPIYNIFKVDDTNYLIEIALAGYSKSELNIELNEGKLIISHDKLPNVDNFKKVIHRGITKKRFLKSFLLAETVVVKEANFVNGLLSIKLEDILPDEKKPTKIQIV